MSLDRMLIPRSSLNHYNTKMVFYTLYVVSLYNYLGKITKEKYSGQMRALRNGTLSQAKNTYKCDLNGKWYNDESPKEVWMDVLDGLDKNQSIPAEALIQTIMLYTNKNYNFAINVLYHEYIKPMINTWYPNYRTDDFIDKFRLGIKIGDVGAIYDNSGWCECCGSRSDTVSVEKSRDNASEKMLDYLHTQKKGNLEKIPRYDGIIPLGSEKIY